MKKEKKWLKTRGYLHLTNQINPNDFSNILRLVKNSEEIARHSFFPLLHKKIPQRRFKIIDYDKNYVPIRKHKKYDKKSGSVKSTKKMRPIHYATHIDSLIYAYYSNEVIQEKYESILEEDLAFSKCISAYRRIPTEDGLRNKNNIDFASDVFNAIRERGECCALAFDIESFFTNLDHKILKKAWSKLLGTASLPKDHYNIFKSITSYSYVLLNDLRGKKKSFDERQLASNRKVGIRAFFDSPKTIRNKIKLGELRVFKNQYHNKEKKGNRKIRGIPQGLPISSMLANLYLLEFDKKVYQKIMIEKGGFYRRYSDDLVVVCDEVDRKEVEDFLINEIQRYKLKISSSKTEICVFKKENRKGKETLFSTGIIKVNGKEIEKPDYPFRYLGFEFYGNKTLIKSANLSKFYRRMIYSVKTKAKRIEKIKETQLLSSCSLYKRKLYRIYSYHGRKSRDIEKIKCRFKIHPERKSYVFERNLVSRKFRGNYLAYVERASRIMAEPAIKKQLRNHWKILQAAINRQGIGGD